MSIPSRAIIYSRAAAGPNADVGQEVYHDLKADDAPQTVEKLLKAYLAHRSSPDETFHSFARRHDGETLRKLADAPALSDTCPPKSVRSVTLPFGCLPVFDLNERTVKSGLKMGVAPKDRIGNSIGGRKEQDGIY